MRRRHRRRRGHRCCCRRCSAHSHRPAAHALFASCRAAPAAVVTYAVTTNPDGYIKEVDETVLLATQVFCGLTWLCWIVGASATATKKD